MKVNEAWREVYFMDGSKLKIENVIEVDNNGTWLRIITDTYYYILNPNLIKYHKLQAKDKVF